jgi:hypothetical protein
MTLLGWARRSASPRWAEIGVATVIASAAVITFSTGLRAGLLSDAFGFLEIASTQSLGRTLAHYLPDPSSWYRPTTESVFWLEARAFGSGPLGYHAVALACHLVSAFLLGAIATRLALSRVAGVITATVFALSIHAQEVVFDIADLHSALGGVALTAAVLAYLRGSHRLALVLTVLALTVDEAGLLIAALVGLHAALRPQPLGSAHGSGFRRFTRQALPFAFVVLTYLGFRLVAGQGGFFNESVPCRTPMCLRSGALDYFNRLLVRPDQLRWQSLAYRGEVAVNTAMAAMGILAVLQPWRWRRRREALFAAGWAAGSAAFYVLTLYPYVADRFVYIPDMGLALVLGVAASEVKELWTSSLPLERAGIAGGWALLAVWLALGIPMLAHRGRLYAQAGDHAQAILAAVQAVVPDPPPGAILVLRNVPAVYTPQIPPGNTGPFLFHNGLDSAVRLRYGRRDLKVHDEADLGPGNVPRGAIRLAIRGRAVVLLERASN